jgi:hypothetical protein
VTLKPITNQTFKDHKKSKSLQIVESDSGIKIYRLEKIWIFWIKIKQLIDESIWVKHLSIGKAKQFRIDFVSVTNFKSFTKIYHN